MGRTIGAVSLRRAPQGARIITLANTKAPKRIAQIPLRRFWGSDHAELAVGDRQLLVVCLEKVQQQIGHFRADLPQNWAADIAVVSASAAGAVAAQAVKMSPSATGRPFTESSVTRLPTGREQSKT